MTKPKNSPKKKKPDRHKDDSAPDLSEQPFEKVLGALLKVKPKKTTGK